MFKALAINPDQISGCVIASGSKEVSQSIKAKASKLQEKRAAHRACIEIPHRQTQKAKSVAVSTSTIGSRQLKGCAQ